MNHLCGKYVWWDICIVVVCKTRWGGGRVIIVVGWVWVCFHFLDRVTLVGVSSGLGFYVRVVMLVVMRLRDNI